jgi:cation transport protein ChaC
MQGADAVWVFAYGSLMWRPDFSHLETRTARLHGWHRSLCVLSTHYRGTRERPGLVLGLDRGGSCLGRAFRVAPAAWAEVCAILHDRELRTDIYEPRFLSARLDDGRAVPAYAFIVARHHAHYWRGDTDGAVALIRQGIGSNGTARDYLASTIAHLKALGMTDRALHRLLRRVDEAATNR